MRIVSVTLDVDTVLGHASYGCRLEPGLNILNAPNSWGKSTLLQSIVYALGLEGSLSTSRRVPLGPAMTQAIDTGNGRTGVIQSYVTVTLDNGRGSYLRVRRWARSSGIEPNLIQVRAAGSEAGLDDARRQDMFVRESGATFSEVGFHRLLEEFVGWSLPLVPSYSDTETRLYLEVLFPLFYVEQKFGWSGIAPRIPTHYRIRDPLQRTVEYVLGLSTLERIRTLEALKEEEAAIAAEWAAAIERLRASAVLENLRAVVWSMKPVGADQHNPTGLQASEGEQWVPLIVAESHWRERLAALSGTVLTAGERTGVSRAELATAEAQVRKRGANVRELREQHGVSTADQDALAARLAGVEADKRRLTDVQRVRRLGGDLELPLIAEGRCPTCQQELDGRGRYLAAISLMRASMISTSLGPDGVVSPSVSKSFQ